MPDPHPEQRGLTRGQRELLERLVKKGGSTPMFYADTGATKQLTELGLASWTQDTPFVATVHITDAGRKVLDA